MSDASGASIVDRPGHQAGAPDAVVRVTGTVDVTDIAAVLVALGRVSPQNAEPTGYERWRSDRLAALHGSRAH